MTKTNRLSNRIHNVRMKRMRAERISQGEVEAMLREIAYALALTHRVKQQILNDQPEPEPVGA
jgi:hypothetical protein